MPNFHEQMETIPISNDSEDGTLDVYMSLGWDPDFNTEKSHKNAELSFVTGGTTCLVIVPLKSMKLIAKFMMAYVKEHQEFDL